MNSPQGDDSCQSISSNIKRGNKAIVPKHNFYVGGLCNHLAKKKDDLDSYINPQGEEPMLQGKEVEEWLMGSGLSIPEATTGCTDSSEPKHISSNLKIYLNTLRDKQLAEEIKETEKVKTVDGCGELEEWMFDSYNENKRKREEIEEREEGEEWGLQVPIFDKSNNKRSPYMHKDQIIEEDEELEDFVDPSEQFGFKNLSSYISQMDKWIEEGKMFK
jgi:hypothetical protein